MPDVEQQSTIASSPGTSFNYDYAVNNSAPTSGKANQATALNQITFNNTDKDGHDNSSFLGLVTVGSAIVANRQVWKITGKASGSGVMSYSLTPAVSSPPFGVTQFWFALYQTLSVFPTFTPIVPPPAIGAGGGAAPTFPPVSPNTAPVPIPPGVMVGPVIAAAAVPPSVAGFPLIQYKTGSATSPTAASWFPQFTTTFPKPTIVLGSSNFATAVASPTVPWTAPDPPMTASTLCIAIGGWGPGVPPGAPTAPGGDGRFPRPTPAGMMVTQAAPVEHEVEPEEPEDEDDEPTKPKTHRRRRK